MHRVGKRKWYGRTDPSSCWIKLSALCKDEEEYLHTFLHELNHAIFWTMGKEKLYRDEAIVDGHASLLLQVLVSGE